MIHMVGGNYGSQRSQDQKSTMRQPGRAYFRLDKPQDALGTMRISIDVAVRVLQCLLEGCSIRSTERLTGTNRNTIMALLLLAGERCQNLMDTRMQNLNANIFKAMKFGVFFSRSKSASAIMIPLNMVTSGFLSPLIPNQSLFLHT